MVIAIDKTTFPMNLWKLMANEASVTGSIALPRAVEFEETFVYSPAARSM